MADEPRIGIAKNLGPVRGLAILLVVFSHSALCISSVRLGPSFASTPLSTPEVLALLFSTTFPWFSVTAFMVASGYFMAKFNGTWPSVRSALRSLGWRYLGWTVVGYLVTGVIYDRLSPLAVLKHFNECLGPFPAYWFLTVMVCVLAVCPWLTRWAAASPKSMLGAILLVELIRETAFYTGYSIPNRIVIETSGFLAGILLAKHTDVVIRALGRHRTAIGIATLLFLGAGLVESAYWWNLLHVRDAHLGNTDRITVRIYAILGTAWLLLAPLKPTVSDWNRRLEQIGLKSMGILLLFDFCQQILYMAFWHGERLLGLTDRSRSEPPAWMANPALVFAYWFAGVAGPLFAMWATERFLGKGLKRTIFG